MSTFTPEISRLSRIKKITIVIVCTEHWSESLTTIVNQIIHGYTCYEKDENRKDNVGRQSPLLKTMFFLQTSKKTKHIFD